MYYGVVDALAIVKVPVQTKGGEVDLRLKMYYPTTVIIRATNDNDEPHITKIDKLLGILDDILREGGDEADEVKDILNKLCNTRR